jgi:hypothetical protein
VLAEQANGYVAGTQADLGGQRGRGRATVTVRVPQDNLSRITSYATIAVELVTGTEPAPVAAARNDDRPRGLRDAADDALHNVADTVAVMTRGAGVVLPLLLLAAGVWIVSRVGRRLSRRAPAPPPEPPAA